MVFRKFIEWVISWATYSIRNIGQRNASLSQTGLLKKIQELEKLISHMSSENEEMQIAFFRNIYHEIRTPMNAILGFSSLLEDSRLSDEKRDNYVDQIWNSSAVFLQFIDDLVETSMLESKRIQLECTVFSMKELMSEIYQVCNRHRHLLDKNCIALLLSQTDDSKEAFAETDRKRLVQLIEYITTGFMMDQEMGVVELGYKTTLNNGLVFCIKSYPVINSMQSSASLNMAGNAKILYDLKLRRRCADKLINIFKGNMTIEPDKTGGQTARIGIKPKSLSYSNPINECNENKKRIAI